MTSSQSKTIGRITRPVVWTIAGSDSSGGAGIQADAATINDLNSHACTVVTSVTAQSSVAVDFVEPVYQQMLKQQLNTLNADLPPKAIKIGLLVDQKQIELIAEWLKQKRAIYPDLVVVLDPVLIASSGDILAESKGLDFSPLKGLIDLITPNFFELQQLSEIIVTDKSDIVSAACALSKSLACSVLAKGGDNYEFVDNQLALDFLVCHQVAHCSDNHNNAKFWFASERIDTVNNHGTGCTLSSAIASVSAYGYSILDAVSIAKAYVSRGLNQSYQLGKGPGILARTGWPKDISFFPTITSTQSELVAIKPEGGFKALGIDLDVYPVVGSVELIEDLLKVGCTTVQLRLKAEDLNDKESEWLEAQIVNAIALGKEYKAQVFINDHWQLALKHNAYGIHLGQEDVIGVDLQAISDAGIALGLSSHGTFEALLAYQLQPSYLAIGHIFPTLTKDMPSLPQGLVKLQQNTQLFKGHIPLVTIGGINKDNLSETKATNVDSIAVVRAITQAESPQQAFKELKAMWMEDK
ncbi:thiamine-phosphate pyrophosphorylase [Parashewanella curva]|uniref:hydroxymethylpyrimidine kinase n=1 Tax=Parashewanella curva TaxID=2338552 RepID=A0A3L8Q2K3_9GAMM|nr:bifunctional hydroxymethylpyrimidine kinase/phosphomethylpyrimidine kinase [Parashewanella curva]RLV61188.1 thiamine-phosphate pyrophosphorylase [Parashewanella curva]